MAEVVRYLLDSNTLIYASQPDARYAGCRQWAERDDALLSAISRVEVLGFRGLSEADALTFAALFRFLPQLPITDVILDRAAGLRRQIRLKTPDAIVAATALEHGLTLVSADRGFVPISGLRVVNPLAM